MPFRDRSVQARTCYLTLAMLLWLIVGGHAWAERTVLETNPRAALARLAEDGRLALTTDQRETLRSVARRPDLDRLLDRAAESRGFDLGPQQREVLHQVAAGPSASPRPKLRAPGKPSPARRLGLLAEELRARAGRVAKAWGGARDELEAAAGEGLERLEEANAEVLAELAAIERTLRRAGLPAEMLGRHATVEAAYLRDVARVRGHLEAAKAGDGAALAAAAEALAGSGEDRMHQVYDPTRPPYQLARPEAREPGQRAAAAGAAKGAVGPRVRRASELRPARHLVARSHTPPVAADLAETPEVKLTPEIRALATSLGNEPLRIYDWVRNHIDFYPTWGSAQSSQRTLDTGRGNAADTATLLIALLRAAGVAARYATGTAEIPAAEAQSWLGGAATPQVAQQILGQGGVASVGLLDGAGALTAIRVEHVWVEAWIDNVPSRGAVHREGDTWLPLDSSFKLYHVTAPSNVFADVPFDAVNDPSDPPFTVDESLGKITAVDPEALDADLAAWVQSADDYMLANGVELSQRGVLGGKAIVPSTSTIFAGSLPYELVERDGSFAELPSSLRHEVRLKGFRSSLERATGSATFDVRLTLPELDTRRLNLTFLPATQADADVLAAARANGAPSLPVYLVDVAPVLQLDGVELARGGVLGMGSDFFLDVVLKEPGRSETVPYQVIAGDEIVIGVTAFGVGQKVVEKRFAAFPVDNAPEYLHQVQLHYWTETDALGEVAAARRNVHPLRLPSVGLFSSTLSVSYLFGAPRTAVYAGRVMDVKRSFVGAAGADPGQVVAWVQHAGLQGSYLEGAVFEQLELIASGTPRPSGISSIHLLMAAASQGVPIYRITPANSAIAVPRLNLSAAVERDITNALAAGQTVLAPESEIDLGPWRGAGYILQDEVTGGGAYLISGGLAGGGLLDCLRELVPVFRFLFYLLLALLLLALLIWLILSAPVWVPATATAAAAFLAFLILWRGLGPTSAPPQTA